MRDLKDFAYLVNNYVQFLLNACISLDEYILSAFGEEKGPIDGPTKRACQGGSHEVFEVVFELWAHHKGGAGVTDIGCELIDLILQTLDQFLGSDLLAFVSGNLFGEITYDSLLFLDSLQ